MFLCVMCVYMAGGMWFVVYVCTYIACICICGVVYICVMHILWHVYKCDIYKVWHMVCVMYIIWCAYVVCLHIYDVHDICE